MSLRNATKPSHDHTPIKCEEKADPVACIFQGQWPTERKGENDQQQRHDNLVNELDGRYSFRHSQPREQQTEKVEEYRPFCVL